MEINLRLIQQESLKDREDYFALQKSVALFPDRVTDDDKSWQYQFENKNRICYVIETVPENSYCGECAVKDISASVPEIEIELMKEYQHQGIGYKAIILMLENTAKKYGKQEFYAKVEPDNYASQYLFEKLKGMPAGLVRDFVISEERTGQFIETHRHMLDERMQNVAKKFEVKADLLLTHLLVYKLDHNALQAEALNVMEAANKKEHIECLRKLAREKYIDILREELEFLEEIMNLWEENGKVTAKMADMESKLLNKMKLMNTIDLQEVKGDES